MGKIRVAVSGIGNCFSSLLQGLAYYKDVDEKSPTVPGLMHNVLCGYRISDIEIVAAFDVDKRKVGRDISEAIFERPNSTKVFCKPQKTGVRVQKGPVMDGVAPHFANYPEERAFLVDEAQESADVAAVLKETRADVLINYLPVGSEEAVRYYAQCAIEAGCAFVNCMPVFIASDEAWAKRFADANLPVLGDDIKAQIGATIVHRTLARLAEERGVQITGTYQLNVGGNTDFLNMIARERLASKKISKTSAVQSNLGAPLPWEKIHVGPSDYVPWLDDNKVCFCRIEGRQFGDVPMNMELRLSVEDSPNSAGIAIDLLRLAMAAKERGLKGAVPEASAYFFKHPPVQQPDHVGRKWAEDFAVGKPASEEHAPAEDNVIKPLRTP